MKPEGMSAGELAGKYFLTTKIEAQEETTSLFPLDVVIGCDAGKTLCYQLDDTKHGRVREREQTLDLDDISEPQD